MLVVAAAPPELQMREMLHSFDCTNELLQRIKPHQENHKSFHKNWVQRVILQGAPNLPTLFPKEQPNGGRLEPEESSASWVNRPTTQPLLLSAEHLYKLSWLSPGCPGDILELALLNYASTCDFHRDILGEQIRPSSQRERGVILIMDMTKSTPFIFQACDRADDLAKRLTMLSAAFCEIGSLIKLQNRLNRFWIAEGDKFIAFLPTKGTKNKQELNASERMQYINFLTSMKSHLLAIKARTKIGFNVGAHYGWINELGSQCGTNEDIIIATRAMEFRKQEDLVIVTNSLRTFALGEDPTDEQKNTIERRFIPPAILQEGKPSVFVRPQEVLMHLHDLPAGAPTDTPRDIAIYELLGEKDAPTDNR